MAIRLFVCLMIGLAFCCGCRNEHSSLIRIAPTDIELGLIAVSGQEVRAKIDIHNTGNSRAKVELLPSCGCIHCPDQVELEAGEIKEISFGFSSTGKSGDFFAEIGIRSEGFVQKIPIHAIFKPEVFVFPSRVILFARGDGSLVGEFRFSTTEDLKDLLRVDFQREELELQELDSTSSETNYRVVATTSKRVFSPLRILKSGQENPVLLVPVISGVP